MIIIYIVLYFLVGSCLSNLTDEDDKAFIIFVAWPVVLLLITGKFIVNLFRTLIRKGEK